MSHSKEKTAVLFVHGMQGSPRQFDFLVRSLPEGVTFINLLLPGHGKTLRDFRRSSRAAWQKSVQQAAETLARDHDRIIFVGHSMGCLLGIRAAMQPGVRFASMLLIACPFRLRFSLRYVRNCLLAAQNRPTRDPEVAAIRAANSVHAHSPLQFLFCLHPYVELIRLIREIRGIRQKPRLRVTAAFPQQDEIVSPASRRIAQNAWRFAPVLLPESGHCYFSPAAQQTLQQILKAML